MVAVGTSIGQVKLFKARTGELVRSLDDEQAKRADKRTPENLNALTRAMGHVTSLAFSPDGSLLAMCGGSIDEFHNPLVPVNGPQTYFLAATGPGVLKVWDVKTGSLQQDLVGHTHANAVSFSPDGNLLASAGSWRSNVDDGTGVIIWNPQTGTKIRTITNEANGHTHAFAFSQNSKLVVIASGIYDQANDTSTTAVSLTHAVTGIMEWQQTVPGNAYPMAFSPDGTSVAVLCGRQSIRFLDTETGTVTHEIRSADSFWGGRWHDFAIAPQGHKLAIGRVDNVGKGSVEIWEFDGLGAAALGEQVEHVVRLFAVVRNLLWVKASPMKKSPHTNFAGLEGSRGPSHVQSAAPARFRRSGLSRARIPSTTVVAASTPSATM
jgi:hypothetical protein